MAGKSKGRGESKAGGERPSRAKKEEPPAPSPGKESEESGTPEVTSDEQQALLRLRVGPLFGSGN